MSPVLEVFREISQVPTAGVCERVTNLGRDLAVLFFGCATECTMEDTWQPLKCR